MNQPQPSPDMPSIDQNTKDQFDNFFRDANRAYFEVQQAIMNNNEFVAYLKSNYDFSYYTATYELNGVTMTKRFIFKNQNGQPVGMDFVLMNIGQGVPENAEVTLDYENKRQS